MTLPLVLAFIYWSQKNNDLLLLTGSEIKKTDGFKMDLFLITTSFVLAGLLSLMMDLKNVDLRGAWPFLIFFISFYGFLFSLIYSLIGLFFIESHKKYTLFFSLFIVLFFSLLSCFPRKIDIFNLMEIELFYAMPILLLSFNLVVILALHLKNGISKKKNP
ncbi:hypothetical protein [Legionella antarctica]|uniref:hypothetical protein n=1 Tax=Legionella antarctica TaxID=2708020 RepID=UPI001567672B|nr:hypothetical protein [Legionella antarctica]